MESSTNPETFFDTTQFKKYGKVVIDLLSKEFFENIDQNPVLPQKIKPGFLKKILPKDPPEDPESLDEIISDTEKLIFKNVLSHQHPRCFANMPANLTHGAVLADLIGMVVNNPQHTWAINPAGTELENVMCDWCAKSFNLPDKFLFDKKGGGVIYNTIGEGNLLIIHAARAKKLKDLGLKPRDPKTLNLVGYYSSHCHYSTPRSMMLKETPVIKEVPIEYSETEGQYVVNVDKFRKMVEEDIEDGLIPFFYGATIGATTTGGADPIEGLANVCQEFKIWLHVDAAWAGTSFVCPEYFEQYGKGLEGIQSIGINLGKWFFTGMCVAMFWIDDREGFKESLQVDPSYLKNRFSHSKEEEVVNYKDWTISTRRRFNSLKVWYVIRSLGLKRIRENVYQNCDVAAELEKKIVENRRFVLFCKRELCIVCFRLVRDENFNLYPKEDLNDINIKLRDKIIENGEFYVIQGEINGEYFVRFIVNNAESGNTNVNKFWEHILSIISDEKIELVPLSKKAKGEH